MATAITMFRTSDGKTFESSVEADTHEAGLTHAAAIESFLDRHYPLPTDGVKPGPARAMARRTLQLYFGEQASEVEMPVEEVAAE